MKCDSPSDDVYTKKIVLLNSRALLMPEKPKRNIEHSRSSGLYLTLVSGRHSKQKVMNALSSPLFRIQEGALSLSNFATSFGAHGSHSPFPISSFHGFFAKLFSASSWSNGFHIFTGISFSRVSRDEFFSFLFRRCAFSDRRLIGGHVGRDIGRHIGKR